MTNQQVQALRLVANAVIEAVKAGGTIGAPGGVMYAAMSAQGCTLDQFEQIMSGLCRAGILRRDGHCYHLADGCAA
jgi:hypothetical protein